MWYSKPSMHHKISINFHNKISYLLDFCSQDNCANILLLPAQSHYKLDWTGKIRMLIAWFVFAKKCILPMQCSYSMYWKITYLTYLLMCCHGNISKTSIVPIQLLELYCVNQGLNQSLIFSSSSLRENTTRFGDLLEHSLNVLFLGHVHNLHIWTLTQGISPDN